MTIKLIFCYFYYFLTHNRLQLLTWKCCQKRETGSGFQTINYTRFTSIHFFTLGLATEISSQGFFYIIVRSLNDSESHIKTAGKLILTRFCVTAIKCDCMPKKPFLSPIIAVFLPIFNVFIIAF